MSFTVMKTWTSILLGKQHIPCQFPLDSPAPEKSLFVFKFFIGESGIFEAPGVNRIRRRLCSITIMASYNLASIFAPSRGKSFDSSRTRTRPMPTERFQIAVRRVTDLAQATRRSLEIKSSRIKFGIHFIAAQRNQTSAAGRGPSEKGDSGEAPVADGVARAFTQNRFLLA
jgi:hypothetical protein